MHTPNCSSAEPGSRKAIIALLDRAESAAASTASTVNPASALQGEAAALRNSQHFFACDYERSLACAQFALQNTPHDWGYPRMFSWLYYAVAHLAKGETATAFDIAYRGLADVQDLDESSQAQMLVVLGLLYWYAGDLKSLCQAASQLLDMTTTRDLLQPMGWAYYLLGIAHYHLNDLAAAEETLGSAVSLRYQLNTLCFAHSAFALSLTQQAAGRPGEAQVTADSIVPYLIDLPSPDMMPIARVFLALGHGAQPASRR